MQHKIIVKTFLILPFFLLASSIFSGQQFAQEVPDGTIIPFANCVQPPDQATVDHATLSDADLETYGLPPRSLFDDQNEWANIVRNAQYQSCAATTTSNTTTETDNTDGQTGNHPNPQWAGYVQTKTNWIAAETYWVVPTLYSDSIWSAASSTWVGIGGTTTIRLVQTGTFQGIDRFDNFTYEAFAENLGNVSGQPGYDSTHNNKQYNLFSVNPGDSMFAYVLQNKMYINDLTSKRYGSMKFGPTPDVKTFECIHERPNTSSLLYGTTFPPLAKTTHANFSSCYGKDVSNVWYAIGSTFGNFNADIITDSNGTLANPGSFTGTGSFPVLWVRSQ